MQTFDLHMHTTFSDGQYTPEEVVKLAADAGITTLSITDHDSVGGLAQGKAAAEKLGVEFINGIEISCQGNRELHLLGLYIDYNDPPLAEACLEFARLREERAHRIIAFLREKDAVISLDEVREIANGSAIIGRPHFAEALVRHGYAATIQEAFDKYLAAADFDRIERPKPTAEAGIALIKGAGGIPVLAHPALLKLEPEAEEALIERLVGFGLKGIECFYSLYSPEQAARYVSIAEKHDLIKTGGSDFHGEKVKPEIRLGGFFCPDDVTGGGIFHAPATRREININDLELVENVGILFENEVVVYGAGAYGRRICKRLKAAGAPASYFCDDISGEEGKNTFDAKVITPVELKELDKERRLVVIAAGDNVSVVEQIIGNIADLKLETDKIYTGFALNFSLDKNSWDHRINKGYKLISEFRVQKARHGWISVVYAMCFNYFDNIDSNIFLYQVGKVGSFTIHKSLTDIGIGNIHTHNINFDGNKAMNMTSSADTTRIITIVREPVSRHLAGIFQTIDYCANSFQKESLVNMCLGFLDWMNKDWRKKGLDLFPLIPERRLFDMSGHDWFDNELKAVFGIDVYAYPFDKEKGYSIIKQGNIEVLVMKMEKLNTLERVIGDFVGAPHFKLINDNEGDNKWYKYIYRNVKDTIKIPRRIFDQYYKNNPKMDHFYSEDEKAAFLKKWEKNIVD